MKELIQQITHLAHQATEQLATIADLASLEQFRIHFLGRNGQLAQLTTLLKTLSLQEKQTVGPLLQNTKNDLTSAYEKKLEELNRKKTEELLSVQQHFDVTAYKIRDTQGTLHPLTHIYNRICSIFISMGYTILDGPELETEFYNFEALNIPAGHPARDMWDTLWVDVPGLLLRTHTSPVQIHALQQHHLPVAVVAPGRVFRHEATDATHDFMFNQVEGMVVGKSISMADLLGTMQAFFQALFAKNDVKIKVRPSYFPFVEPGIEVDVSCPFCTAGCSICKHSSWIELGGAGMIHPHVLQSCAIDPTLYSGFTFGCGIDRFAMLAYSIPDIRLFTSNKIDFLKQFS